MNKLPVAVVALSLAVAIPSAQAADSATYAYDDLGRLVTVTYANGTTLQYTYDLAGNRIAQQVTCSAGGC